MFKAILILFLFLTDNSYAACSSPSGVSGQVQYISSDMKYCDGTNWISMTESNLGTSCTGEDGKISWLSPNLRFCNGTNWIKMNTTTNAGSASGATAGTMRYHSGSQKMQVSNGSDWYELQSTAPVIEFTSPAAGMTCVPTLTTYSVTVTNTGTATSSTVSVGLSGADAGAFTIVNNTCTTVLAASATCTFEIETPLDNPSPPFPEVHYYATLTATAVSGGSSIILLESTNAGCGY